MKIRPLEPPENRKAFLAILNFIRGDHEGLLEKVSKIVRLKQLIQESKTPQKETDSRELQESSAMRLMFYRRRGIKDLFEYALDVAQKISTGTPWVSLCDQYSFYYKTNIIDRQFKNLGPCYAIFFEVLKDIFEGKSIPDEIVKDEYYRIYTRKREEILKFVKGQIVDLDHRSRQDYFECAVLAAILYWRKKITWDDFKTYVLSKQKILRNKTETHAINLLCHIAVMDAHAHTHDFPQLCTLTNNFLDNLGLRPLTQNEIIQKLDNWLLRLDPYDEIRKIRKQGDISSAVTLIRDHQYNNLVAALDVLWPEAKREVYLKAICGQHQNVALRNAVASNPNTSQASLVLLAKDEEIGVRSSVAGNPRTPSEILYLLAHDTEPLVRMNIASNPGISPEILLLLAQDEDTRVLKHALKNPGISYEIFAELAKKSAVKSLVAQHPSVPGEILAFLSEDDNSEVRAAVAGNPDADLKTLNKLAKDKNSLVQEIVLRNNKYPKRPEREKVSQILRRDEY